MRLAFFSPLPPSPTGIADYAADVLVGLAPRHEIELFHDQEEVDEARLPEPCARHRASAFAARHAERPYDLAVYQMGNGMTHAFVYDHLARLPGLLVLHDLVLHHSRARMLLESPEALAYARDPSNESLRDAAMTSLRLYRDEIAYCYPEQAGRLDEAHLSTVGDLLPYAYPLFRLPVEASRARRGPQRASCKKRCARRCRTQSSSGSLMPVRRVPVRPEQVAAAALSTWRRAAGVRGRELRLAHAGEAAAHGRSRRGARPRVWRDRLRLMLVGPVPDASALWRDLSGSGCATPRS